MCVSSTFSLPFKNKSSTFSFTHDMEDNQHRHPLLATDPDFAVSLPSYEMSNTRRMVSSDSSTCNIILRLVLVVLVGCISLWASNEANKGFQITIINDAHNYSLAGRRFQLLYVSNDKATQLILEASQLVNTLLYDSTNQTYKKKQVNHVMLRLACQNLTQSVTVDSYEDGNFVINLSPSIMDEANVKGAMLRAVGQGMAGVWIFDNRHNAPISLIDGLVEYIGSSAAHVSVEVDSDYESEKSGHERICWKDENPKGVARFLRYCEEHRKGFIQRLNQAMSQASSWHDQAMDDVLGMPAPLLCSSYTSQELLLCNSLDCRLSKI